jgi:hypothetical protein
LHYLTHVFVIHGIGKGPPQRRVTRDPEAQAGS